MQDESKVVLGATQSTIKDSEQFDVDPANFLAGSCVSLASTGLPSLLKSAGFRIGVSLGKSLADHKKTAVLRSGLRVPVLAALKRASAVVTIDDFANLLAGGADTVTVGATEFTSQSGAATLGDATFRAATSNEATATSLATQINAHATAGALVYAVAIGDAVHVFSRAEGDAGNDIAIAYTDNGGNTGATLTGDAAGKLDGGSDDVADIDYAVAGGKMYVNDVTGKADVAMTGFSTISDALYSIDPVKTGIREDGTEVAAVLVDMQGGL